MRKGRKREEGERNEELIQNKAGRLEDMLETKQREDDKSTIKLCQVGEKVKLLTNSKKTKTMRHMSFLMSWHNYHHTLP